MDSYLAIVCENSSGPDEFVKVVQAHASNQQEFTSVVEEFLCTYEFIRELYIIVGNKLTEIDY